MNSLLGKLNSYPHLLFCLFFSQMLLAQDRFSEFQRLENQIVLLRNDQNLIPIPDLTKTTAIVSLASTDSVHRAFADRANLYVPCAFFSLSEQDKSKTIKVLDRKLKPYSQMILLISSENAMTEEMQTVLEKWVSKKNSILVSFGKKENLEKMPFFPKINHLVFSPEASPLAQDLAAQLVFGGIRAKGVLQENIYGFEKNVGLKTEKSIRLKYTLPEELGFSPQKIQEIDSLAEQIIRLKATPSAQMMAIRDGKVFYWKAFGHTTYDSTTKASLSNIYDMASVTKVCAALPALMKLVDGGKLDLDKNLAEYLPDFAKTNKKDMNFRDLLAHQARLKAWIPFWQKTLDKNKNLDSKWFNAKKTRRFSVQVAENLFLHRRYARQIYQQIKDSPLQEKKEYLYSDLSFYLYPLLVRKLAGQDFEEYLWKNFYEPLGANTLGFKPLRRFERSQIVPTEYDSLFRKQLIWGYAHDEGAAMLGGVSGHAGLFANMNDLAKLLQMYLQKGEYGGKRFLKPETVAEFTKCQFCETGNRRSLGFDRPQIPMPENPITANTAKQASAESYGHTGFTGNYIWVDPAQNLIFLFFSNRVYPTRNNRILMDNNFRPILHHLFYNTDL